MAEIRKPWWNKEWKPKSVLYEHAPLSWEINRVLEMCVLCHSLSNILTEGNRNSGQWRRKGEFYITGTRARQKMLQGFVRETRKKENHSWECATRNINRDTRVGIPLVLLKSVKPIFISVFNQLDAQNLFHNKFYFMPLHVSSTCAHHHTYRCDDTRGCVMQFWPPDDEHICSKHVEEWNKTYCETHFVHQVG